MSVVSFAKFSRIKNEDCIIYCIKHFMLKVKGEHYSVNSKGLHGQYYTDNIHHTLQYYSVFGWHALGFTLPC